VVGLSSANGDDGIRALCNSIAQQEFELPQLVAASAKAHHIIPLHKETNSVQLLP
jgi:hypothetical protein